MATLGVPAARASAAVQRYEVRRRGIVREVLVGWRDGRRGLPLVRGGAVVPTGHMHAIASDAGEQLDGVYVQLLDRTRGDRVEYAGSAPRLTHFEELLERHRADLAELQGQGPRLGRRMGEDSLTDDQVQRRRIREHRLAVQRAAARAAGVREEIAFLQQRRLALYAQVECWPTAGCRPPGPWTTRSRECSLRNRSGSPLRCRPRGPYDLSQPLPLREDVLNFKDNSPELVNPADAQAQVATLVDQLKDTGGAIRLTGTTASGGEEPGRLQLSKARAETAKALFEKMGIDADRITTEGVGTNFPGFQEDLDALGNQIEEIAARNRSVIVTVGQG